MGSKDQGAMNDDGIVELFWNRDERAITETDLLYGRYIHSLQYNILGNNEDVEECRNDTYLQLWKSIPPNRPKVLIAYITKIARDIAISRMRGINARKRIPTQLTVSLDELKETIGDMVFLKCELGNEKRESETIGRIISNFLREENIRNRRIFIMRYYYADSAKDIAGVLGIGERMVYHELKSMKKRLKEAMKKEKIRIQD